MDTTMDWAQLDESNKAHYTSKRKPEFYRAAKEAEEQALAIWNAAIDEWIDCPANQVIRLAELRRAAVACEERWLDCRSATITLYNHWQRLIYYSSQPCECTPETVCKCCQAKARLADPNYEPLVTELLKE